MVSIFVIVLGAALFLGYTYYKETGLLTSNNTPSQLSAEVSEKLETETIMEWDNLLDIAREDCETVKEMTLIVEQEEYFSGFRSDMFAALGVTDENTLESFLVSVPRTTTCWAFWAGDEMGQGFGGYRKATGEVEMYSIMLPTKVLEENVSVPGDE